MMKTKQMPFDKKTGEWTIAWPGRVSRHDLVYLSPPTDPMEGIPLGNGDIGALCWCENSKLIFAINKCDLWDDAPFDRFINWSRENEEKNTTLRHACRFIIDFKFPIFDTFYLSDFKARLSLADASLSLSAAGPFGEVTVNAFLSRQEGLLRCTVNSKLKENSVIDLILERFGSRTFAHWYSQINRDCNIGLKGTDALFDKSHIYIKHILTSGSFAAGCKIISEDALKLSYNKEHSHASKIVISGSNSKVFTACLAVTSPLSEDPISEVKKKLKNIKDISTALKIHKKEWKKFWLHSLMESGNDYLDKLWHLTMYYANASQQGCYPGRFINGLWGWNRDVQQWNFYFHWNQQQIYWPLNAAGHHDLIDSYLNFRFNSLPVAKEDAKKICHAEGTVISDVSERHGYNSVSEFSNHTPIAQIAMDFYRQYKFTGDKKFLKEKVYPFILDTALFFESLFEKDKNGIYHAKEGTGYEGWIKLKDCISELVYAKVLFSAAINVIHECGFKNPMISKWQEIINNIAPLPVIKADNICFRNEEGILKYNKGFFNGDTAFSNKILAAGFGITEKKWLSSRVPSSDKKQLDIANIYEFIQKLENNQIPYNDHQLGDMSFYNGIFPGVECSSVYPSGLTGIADSGTDLHKAAANTAKLYAPDCMGWDPLPIVLARLGLGDELKQILESWPSRWQFYSNGFGHYGPMDVMKAEASIKNRIHFVKDVSLAQEEAEKNKFPLPAHPFRHMGMESMSVLACAMNESLLQSYDGVIRVAPAVTQDQNAQFTLHAQDGFIVSSEIKNGKVLWISVISRFGKKCRIQNPWENTYIYKNGSKTACIKQQTIEFPTSKNDIFAIVPNERIIENWKILSLRYEENDIPQTSPDGRARLGLPRMF